jgi:hypothetical protein
MKTYLMLPAILAMAATITPAYANAPGEGTPPDAILGTDNNDAHFFLTFALVRNESIDIVIQPERRAQGRVLACAITLASTEAGAQGTIIATDNGRSCHIALTGSGLRSYVLHITNLDERHPHDIYINMQRGTTPKSER